MQVLLGVNAAGLGSKIRAARKGQSYTVDELARLAGMTRSNWFRIENEETKSIPEETLRRIESALGVSFGITL